MSDGARTALTLAGLTLLLVVGGLWGWSAVTAPFPHEEEPPVCVAQRVSAGDKVFRDQVTVSVYNASRRAGLAGATSAQLEERGFHIASTGNAPAGVRVRNAQVWAGDPGNPAVRLVRSQLGGAQVEPTPDRVDADEVGSGVVVVLGDRFGGLVKGRQAVRVGRAATICSPPDSE